jgi:hypothetical protein
MITIGRMKKNDINIIDIISTYGDISELKFMIILWWL